MTQQDTTILEVLAEGGSITVVGRQVDGEWKFNVLVNERVLEDEGGTFSETPASTWSEAMTRLERYPWRRLRTHYVHPDFKEQVEAARKAVVPRSKF
jgi:hypothetical protein